MNLTPGYNIVLLVIRCHGMSNSHYLRVICGSQSPNTDLGETIRPPKWWIDVEEILHLGKE